MNSLLKYSAQQKQKADKILIESGILEELEEYGKIHIAGSYAINTMYRSELDIWVIGKYHNEELARKIFISLFNKNYFDMLCFVKARNTTFEKKISGFYIQPHKNLGNNNWKIDIWLTVKSQFKPRYKSVLKKINSTKDPNRTRNLILNLKKHFSHKSKYRGNLSGDDFYKVVLENPNSTVEELIELIKRK